MVFQLFILVRIILSWVAMPIPQPLAQLILEVTDPYLRFFRRIIPPLGMMDFSPIVAIFVLNIGEDIVVQLLIRLASML